MGEEVIEAASEEEEGEMVDEEEGEGERVEDEEGEPLLAALEAVTGKGKVDEVGGIREVEGVMTGRRGLGTASEESG